MGETAGCTIVARNYLPFARICARSYLDQHPTHRFIIAIIDAPVDDEMRRSVGGRAEIVDRSVFGIDDDTYLRMATAYSVTEFATAVKPYLLRTLLRTNEVVVYLDPDVEVFGAMDELTPLAREFGIVLTPHCVSPMPRDGLLPSESSIMATGIFNLGFIAVGPGSGDFIDFWSERLRQDAIIALHQQLFTDQRWIDNVPALFSHHVLRDPGYNVAYWNLHEREVNRQGNTLIVGGHALRFFHFSGFRPEQPWILSHHCLRNARVVLSRYPAIADLCRRYADRLADNGYGTDLNAVPYGFGAWPGGAPISQSERRVFREDWVAAERVGLAPPPHAFGSDGGAALRALLRKPADPRQAAAHLNRLAMMAWSVRPDVQAVYPDPLGVDAAGFRQWCRNAGPKENMLPDWAVPAEPEPPMAPAKDLGVNLVAYFTAELGVGEVGRLMHEVIEAAHLPIASSIEEQSVVNRKLMPPPASIASPRFGVSIFVVNADQMSPVREAHPQAFQKRYRIGVWAWELEEFPEQFHHAFDLVDEVWTVSEFVKASLLRHTAKPVHVFPVPVRDPGVARDRSRQGVCRFLYAFDFNSVATRKNPLGLVEAFRRAFPGRDDVRLIIKAINGSMNLTEAERLRARVAADERIILLEQYLSIEELDALYRDSDAYVSLHRSEGFGLTVAEAMARALPVVATDYAATREFFDDRVGWPVPYRLIPVGPGCGPYDPAALWADPDLDAAAEAMCEIADNPLEAKRRGEAARAHVMQTRSIGQAADWLMQRIEASHEAWLNSSRMSGDDAVERASDVMTKGRWALEWKIWPEKEPRNRLKRMMHNASLQATLPYEAQLRRVQNELYDSTHIAIDLLQDRLDRIETRLDALAHRSARADVADDERRGRRSAADMDAVSRANKRMLDDHERRISADEGDRADLRRIIGSLADAIETQRSDAQGERTAKLAMFTARDERMDGDE